MSTAKRQQECNDRFYLHPDRGAVKVDPYYLEQDRAASDRVKARSEEQSRKIVANKQWDDLLASGAYRP